MFLDDLKNNYKKRETSFEIIRIISMLLIVSHHFIQHGFVMLGKSYYDGSFPVNLTIARILFGWTAAIGNYLFILISGWFLCTAEFSWKRLFKIWFQMFTTSFLIGIVAYGFKFPVIGYTNKDFGLLAFEAAKTTSLKDLLISFIPTYWESNWFANKYLVFYLFSPLLLKSIQKFTQKQHLYAAWLLIFMGTILPMIPGEQLFHGSEIFFFIMGYYVMSYIRLYKPKCLENKVLNRVLILIFLILFLMITLNIFEPLFDIPVIGFCIEEGLAHIIGISYFPTLIFCILLFMEISGMKIKQNIVVNYIASLTFGVYLIHENALIKHFLWFKVFKVDTWVNSNTFWYKALLSIVLMFVLSCILEIIRRGIIYIPEKLLMKKVEKIPNPFQKEND